MRFAYKHINSPVAYCALTIGAGTRDEDPDVNGVAHFTEHMIFKGTNHRSSVQINNLLERCGGELNAFTTKEETVVNATVLKEDLSKAIGLLFDIVFNSTFPEEEFTKEKNVILEEIKSYKDSPSELIYDDFESYLFGDHQLSRPILGTTSTVKRINVGDIKNFTSKFYLPGNMTFSIVSELPEERCLKLVGHYFGLDQAKEVEYNNRRANCDFSLSINTDKVKTISKKTHQIHCIVGSPAFSLYSRERIALSMLTNILGGPAINSRFNQLLRERSGLVYTVEASYTPYMETGIFTVYFGTDKSKLDKSLKLVKHELERMRSSMLSATAVKSAKKQLLGQLAISMDNPENLCLSMGKSLLAYNKVETIDYIREKIEETTAEELQQIASEIFSEEKMKILIYK